MKRLSLMSHLKVMMESSLKKHILVKLQDCRGLMIMIWKVQENLMGNLSLLINGPIPMHKPLRWPSTFIHAVYRPIP